MFWVALGVVEVVVGVAIVTEVLAWSILVLVSCFLVYSMVGRSWMRVDESFVEEKKRLRAST